jgi:hypothetical protein
MPMILTVLEAQVVPECEQALRTAYDEAVRDPRPLGLLSSTLSRTTVDPTLWRIETLWSSRAALDALRGTGTPRGIQIFRAAGAEPIVTVLEVVAVLPPPAGAP